MTPHDVVPLSVTRRNALAAVLAAALVAGCATAPRTPEDQVRARAQARWAAQLAGDTKASYEFLSPGSRALVSPERFRARNAGAVTYKEAEVVSVVCETSEKCVAKVKVSYEPVLIWPRMGTIESYLEETWLVDGGQWWLLYKL
ncbi:hypothetical protein [Azohydromonas sp.]|uniref:hypothetical protein n=1 Tax=Azohydromonas sp. TaxID=1872666 RepID=UPI002CC4714C|nr:hypothetical protein [Azohydromonas sp.]HMM85581.1 hypothetical protein [Azohydromonas sp.]